MYHMTIWSILRPLEIFYGHLVYFVVIWYIFRRFGIFGPRKIWQPCFVPAASVFSRKGYKKFWRILS
jgi:hypothetical protein